MSLRLFRFKKRELCPIGVLTVDVSVSEISILGEPGLASESLHSYCFVTWHNITAPLSHHYSLCSIVV
ncbi:hypothetical protein L6164_009602 [Bauhinia variegata]|uniref:Uncharacterized protein n=1 Tax=Bauhinia variegata TaxID=167791 RepID=A0ACB9PJI5_BAUVA|nr:hypothetical protein L6164_009602 [Bauhinia variegata]